LQLPNTERLTQYKLSLEVVLLVLIVITVLYLLVFDRPAALKAGLAGR
jgi:hypothetical protein